MILISVKVLLNKNFLDNFVGEGIVICFEKLKTYIYIYR